MEIVLLGPQNTYINSCCGIKINNKRFLYLGIWFMFNPIEMEY